MRIAAALTVGLAASEWLQDATTRLESYCWRQHVFAKPIDYSIPNRKWWRYAALRQGNAARRYDFAPLIPGDARTYEYAEEQSYLEMYSSAFFCITKKKGGWDCLRHYEILLAGCMPYFLDIEFLPSSSMVNFPRDLVQALMHLPGVPSESSVVASLDNGTALRIDHQRFPLETFQTLREMVLQYVEDFMLSTHRASDLQIATPRVFIQSKSTLEKPVDYLRELLVVGLLELGLEVFLNCNVDYVFEDFDVDRQGETWKTSYGRGFLYERALPPELKSKLHFWHPGDVLPEPLTYIKTTYNNQPFPSEDLLSKGPDILVDGNDIWAPHLDRPVKRSLERGWRFQRELTACHELQRPAQLLMGTLDSGDLWTCDQAPGSPMCPNLHQAATVWYEGLKVVPLLQAHEVYRNEEMYDRVMGDIEDYLRTPPGHPDFVEKYQAIAVNSRQIMDSYRSMIIRTDRSRAASFLAGPRGGASADHLAECGWEAAKAAKAAKVKGESFEVEDPCHWGFPRHALLALLHVLNPMGSWALGDRHLLRGCLFYGLAAAKKPLWTADLPELLQLFVRLRGVFLEVLFPVASLEAAAAAAASATALLGNDYRDGSMEPASLMATLKDSWSRFDATLKDLDIADWELKAWLQELTAISTISLNLTAEHRRSRWPWWRMVQRSGQLRYSRRGLLEQVASLR
eukprot:s15_g21.t1